MLYSDLTGEAQSAYDNLTNNRGWSVSIDEEAVETASMITDDETETLDTWAGTIIEVTDPGQNNDILANLETAWDSASGNELILLPKGDYIATGEIIFGFLNNHISGAHIMGRGNGYNGTRVYRDYEPSDNERFIEWRSTSGTSYTFEMSGIYWQGPDTITTRTVDAFSIDKYDFYIHDCKFSQFTGTIVHIIHEDNIDSVISENVFEDNYYYDSGDSTYYGSECMVVAGTGGVWPEITFGSSDFVFIEDNYFNTQYEPVDGAEAARFVLRNNVIDRSLTGRIAQTHPAQPDWVGGAEYYAVATRAAEIYNNISRTMSQSSNPLPDDYRGIAMIIGGEVLIHNNILIESDFGVFLGLAMGWCDCGGDAPSDYDPKTYPDDYPIPYQAGYESGVSYGISHTGTDPSTYGEGDLYTWGNTLANKTVNFNTWGEVRVNLNCAAEDGFLQENRDYHIGTARPNYTPYTYPHPRRT
jgi:hypothetical protein